MTIESGLEGIRAEWEKIPALKRPANMLQFSDLLLFPDYKDALRNAQERMAKLAQNGTEDLDEESEDELDELKESY